LDQLVRQAFLVLQDLQDLLVKQDHQERQDQLAVPGIEDLLESLVLLGQLVLLDYLVSMDVLENVGLLDLLGQQDQEDLLAK
jgi:hypothetical protein